MKRLAIMQPYLFPYVGYFQLINAVDKFVIYDDVNYIQRGWINRNNILVNGSGHLFTIPLKDASQNRLINEIELAGSGWESKFLKTIEQAYKKSKYFPDAFPIVYSIINNGNKSISELTRDSIFKIADYLGISTLLEPSSKKYGNNHLKGQDRILDICQREKAQHYINPIGGQEIYSRKLFEDAGIQINFLKTGSVEYKQWGSVFVPNLSMIDILMFNSKEEINKLLSNYELV
jgi:hypothetical protein